MSRGDSKGAAKKKRFPEDQGQSSFSDNRVIILLIGKFDIQNSVIQFSNSKGVSLMVKIGEVLY